MKPRTNSTPRLIGMKHVLLASERSSERRFWASCARSPRIHGASRCGARISAGSGPPIPLLGVAAGMPITVRTRNHCRFCRGRARRDLGGHSVATPQHHDEADWHGLAGDCVAGKPAPTAYRNVGQLEPASARTPHAGQPPTAPHGPDSTSQSPPLRYPCVWCHSEPTQRLAPRDHVPYTLLVTNGPQVQR
jgi:hypothetical protein